MPETPPIPLESIHNYTDRELLLLTVDRLNGLTGEIRTFVALLDGKVTRKEYEDHVTEGKKLYDEVKGEIKEIKGRVYKLENVNENKTIGENTIKEYKGRIWAVILGFIAVIEFLVLVASA